MADTTNLTRYLGDLADAIRAKRGTTDEILAKDFDKEIAMIETGVDTTDATATAEDIKMGKTAYVNDEKITGTLEELDTSDATATEKDIIAPKTAYVNGKKVMGAIIDHTDLDVMVNVAEDGTVLNDETKVIQFSSDNYDDVFAVGKGHSIGLHTTYEKLAETIGLTSDKIIIGKTVLGIEGEAESGNDTSDATATSEDIRTGKTAYARGIKLEGTFTGENQNVEALLGGEY